MKQLAHFLFGIFSLLTIEVKAQNFFRIDQTEYPFQIAFGGGPFVLKDGGAITIKPLFKEEIGMSMHVTPYFFLSERTTIGIRLGGSFRPGFQDSESNSYVQPKFAPFGLLTSDIFLGRGERRVRAYLGLSAGMTYIGDLEGRTLDTDQSIVFKRRNKDSFLVIAPKAGIAFGTARIEFEYFVTKPFNPDYFGVSLIGSLPVGRQKYF